MGSFLAMSIIYPFFILMKTTVLGIGLAIIVVEYIGHSKVYLNHSHKKWKISRSFFKLMLRTKLYWSPFFSTLHQNINKQIKI